MTLPGGTWLAATLRHGYNRRPHLFLRDGDGRSACGRSYRPVNGLVFDPETGLTEVDPRMGEPQYRRACDLCLAIEVDYDRSGDPADDALDLADVGSLPIEAFETMMSAGYSVRGAVLCVLGTDDDGIQHFRIDTTRATPPDTLAHLVSRFTWTAGSVAFTTSPTHPNAPAKVQTKGTV